MVGVIGYMILCEFARLVSPIDKQTKMGLIWGLKMPAMGIRVNSGNLEGLNSYLKYTHTPHNKTKQKTTPKPLKSHQTQMVLTSIERYNIHTEKCTIHKWIAYGFLQSKHINKTEHYQHPKMPSHYTFKNEIFWLLSSLITFAHFYTLYTQNPKVCTLLYMTFFTQFVFVRFAHIFMCHHSLFILIAYRIPLDKHSMIYLPISLLIGVWIFSSLELL